MRFARARLATRLPLPFLDLASSFVSFIVVIHIDIYTFVLVLAVSSFFVVLALRHRATIDDSRYSMLAYVPRVRNRRRNVARGRLVRLPAVGADIVPGPRPCEER